MDHVVWSDRPALEAPVVVAAFGGWNDAGDAATLAVRHLITGWRATRFAGIAPEEFFDFQQPRPQVHLVDGTSREVIWPPNELWCASPPGRDVVIVLGTEPQLRWRTFCRQIIEVAQSLGANMVLTLGALLADVSHNRPVSIIGTATDPQVVRRYGLQHSRYEGPTGIVGVLHDLCAQAGLESASLWAAVPSYASGAPSPKAALALVEHAMRFTETSIDVSGLASAADEYEREIESMVSSDDDLQGYVNRIEANDDSDDDDLDDLRAQVEEPASTERLLAELEQFLRDQGSA